MFQFTGLTSDIIGYPIARVGCPIRIFTDQRLFAPPRNFSQLITSFIVSESQGIPRTPLLTFFYLLYLQVNCSKTTSPCSFLFLLFTLLFPICQRTLSTSSLPFPGVRTELSLSWLQNAKLMRGYHRIRTDCCYAPPHILHSKRFKFQVSSSKLFNSALFHLITIHFPINCMNVCCFNP